MSTTINTDLTLETLSVIYDKDKFYVKIFKDLLDAAITDDFTKLSRTATGIRDLFYEIKNGSDTKVGVKSFIENNIYEKVFSNSTLYEGMISLLIDIYSVMYTVVRLRRDITEISIQPDAVVDAYLDSFGFKCKELFNYIQKREIVKVIYQYLRRKGTPSLIIKFLNILGFNYFFISEFELCETNDTSYQSTHKFVSRLVYEQKPENDTLGFFNNIKYSYSDVKNYDPLLIKTDKELSNDSLISYPNQSSYYQIGISVTYPDLEYRIAAFSNAMVKKLRLDEENGEDIFTCRVSGYDNKVSYISLLQAQSYIMGEYFGIKEYEDINDNGSLMIFGWNKDITNQTPLEIMYDIEREMKRLFSLVSWYPDEPKNRLAVDDDSDNVVTIEKNTIKTRREEALKEIEDTFYIKEPLYLSYYDMVQSFKNHDPNFKAYVDSILLSKDKIESLVDNEEDDELEKNYNNVLDLLDAILESMEYYIFDNTSFMIPVKNLAMSYANAIEILKKLDKYYTPYHAKLLYPLVVWVIRDLPGDVVAIEDIYIRKDEQSIAVDVVMRAGNYKILDQDLPEAYAPILDWENERDDNPHIPVLSHYKDDEIYSLEDIQYMQLSNNDLLYVTGYDWRNLSYYPLIVRGMKYQLYTDWDPDEIKSEFTCKIDDKISFIQPDYTWMDDEYPDITYFNVNKYDVKLEREKEYNVDPSDPNYDPTKDPNNELYDPTNGTGNKNNERIEYDIEHGYNTKDVFIEVYDKDTGETVDSEVEVLDTNSVVVRIDDNPFNNNDNKDNQDKEYSILITAPLPPGGDVIQKLNGQLFKIVDIGYLKNFMCITNLTSNNFFWEFHHKDIGQNMIPGLVRKDNNIVYLSLNNLDIHHNDRYTLGLIEVLDENSTIDSKPSLFGEWTFRNIDIEEQQEYIIQHNFRTANIITRIYDLRTGLQVHALVEKLDAYSLSINFSKTVGSGSYRVVLMATIERFFKTALPLNNLTGHSEIIKCDGVSTSYIINHNLNSFSTFEQMIEKDTGYIVNVSYDRIDEDTIRVNIGESFLEESKDKEYIINIFAPLNIATVKFPSTIYNTSFESYTIEYDPNHPRIRTYQIDHNMNNDKVVVQIYDSHNRKVNGLVKILDKNSIKLVLGKSISKDEHLKLNVLSLPDTSIPLTNFDDYRKSNYFINMYDCIISKDDYTKDKSIEIYEGGDSSTEVLDDKDILDFGDSSIRTNSYISGGNASTGSFIDEEDDGGPTTFVINHNMSTDIIIVNVFNNRTNDTVDAYIAINDSNSITIGIDQFNEVSDDLHVVIIGALRSYITVDNRERYDVDYIDTIQPFQYTEIKYKESDNYSHHISDVYYRYDIVDGDTNTNTNYILDGNHIRETVDIIHEIKSRDNEITIIKSSSEDGFNKNDILTNDPIWDKNVREDVFKPYLQLYKKED